MEKLSDGACVFRTLEEEEKASRRHEERRQEQLEKLYSALQTAKEEPSLKGRLAKCITSLASCILC